jgi:protein O-mannosyl-transferase
MLPIKREQLYVVLLLSLVVVAYGNALANGFAQDDELYIFNNHAVTAPSFKSLLAPNQFSSVFRPVTFGSFAANWALRGGRPLSYHAVNLVLHAAVTLLLYLVLRALLEPAAEANWVALVAALLFAVHPIHTEAVTFIVGRAELLAAGFFLAAWLLHLRERPILALVCFVLAVLSKESAVAFLPLILVADYARGKMKPLWRYVGVACATVLYVVVLWEVNGGRFGQRAISFLDNPLASLPAKLRVLNALSVAWKYVALQIYPAVLSCDYSYNQITLYSNWRHLLPALVATVALLSLWVWAVVKRWTGVAVAGAIYLAGFAVTANVLIPTGTIMGERLAYLPSAGFCLLVAVLWYQLAAKQPKAAWVLLGVVLVAFCARTIVRNRDWQNNYSLYTAAVRAVPGSAKMHAALGTQYNNRGEYELAKPELEKAIAIFPEYPEALESYGLLKARMGQDAEALQLLQKAVAMSDKGSSMNYDFMVVNAAAQLMKMDKNDEALALLDKDISQSPEYGRAWANRAVLHYKRGETQAARSDAQMALRLDPENAQARNLLRALGEGSSLVLR